MCPGGGSRENLPAALQPWKQGCSGSVSLALSSFSAGYLKEKLDKYMSRFPKVKILHLKERHGLIRARLAGAEMARGGMKAVPQPCPDPPEVLIRRLQR